MMQSSGRTILVQSHLPDAEVIRMNNENLHLLSAVLSLSEQLDADVTVVSTTVGCML